MYPPYRAPFYGGPAQLPYYEKERQRRDLRHSSNILCWLPMMVIGFTTVFQLICRGVLAATGNAGMGPNDFGGYPPILYYLAMAVPNVLGFSIPVFIVLGARHISLQDTLPCHGVSPLTAIACIFFSSGVCMLANFPANMVVELEKVMGFSGELPGNPLNDDPLVLAVYAIMIAVVAPLVEELIFRGAILSGLRRYGDGFAVLGSAFLFALMHGNFMQMVFAFICGVVMGFAVVKTNNIWIAIGIHFLNNATSVGMQIGMQYLSEGAAEVLSNVLMFGLIGLGVLAMVFLLVFRKRFFQLEKSKTMLCRGEKAGAFFGNAGCIVFMSYCLLNAMILLVYPNVL